MSGENVYINLELSKPTLLVISGFSGSGKTSIRDLILEAVPDAKFSISITTREKRTAEREGIDYIFLTHEKFEEMSDRNELLEKEEVHGNYYGTPLKPVMDALEKPGLFIFDVDVKGGLTIKKRFPEVVLVFITPPDIDVLVQRLEKRDTENRLGIEKRLKRIPEEKELSKQYDHKVVNENLEAAVQEIGRIIKNFQSDEKLITG